MTAPRIFVSHSHEDDAFTERFVEDLRRAGAEAWMDKTDLGAGNFQQRISDALANCSWFVLVLSPAALASPWVRQEVDAANRLKHQGQIHDLVFVMSSSVNHRELPPLWGVYNIFDATNGYAQARAHVLKAVGLVSEVGTTLISTVQAPPPIANTPPVPPIAPDHFPRRLASQGFVGKTALVAGKVVEYIVPPLCPVPAGSFLMGSDPKRDKETYGDEQPQHTIMLPAYQVACYPVTVAEYACFVRAGQAEPPGWQDQLSKLDHPVVSVSWHNSVAYAAWLAERSGQPWRLPTEAEWEKAARGSDGRIYPWGDQFDKARCNTNEGGKGGTTPVGSYPGGASPYGALDMAGNVWEWTSTLKREYPYSESDGREDVNSTENRVLRGGSWSGDAGLARAAFRVAIRPDGFHVGNGFRLELRSAPISG
jgi:formylglycine-generating enzyme required for sulfatase activity